MLLFLTWYWSRLFVLRDKFKLINADLIDVTDKSVLDFILITQLFYGYPLHSPSLLHSSHLQIYHFLNSLHAL